MSQSRAFSVLMILLGKRKVSREYLAERFSVSKRTVSRYLSILLDAGVPIISTTGPGGGVALSDDYMLDKAYMTESEYKRIKNALELTADKFSDNVNLVLAEKIDAINKSREQDGYAVKQADLYIDCDYEQAAELKPKIKAFAQAIEQLRAVDIKYTDARGSVSYRTIEPYTLVFKAGSWYIYAMCKLRGDFRLFKLSRISDLRKTSKRFAKNESRLTEKLELEFYNEIYTELEFEFFPAVTESIVDWLGLNAVTERGTKLVAHAEVPLTSALVKRLLSYGSSIKILRPAELIDTVREEAARTLALYGDA